MQFGSEMLGVFWKIVMMYWLKENWFKFRRHFIVAIILILVLPLLYLWPFTTAKIKYDFNKAFTYRLTGDCVVFSDYVNKDQEDWKRRCEEEKGRSREPIKDYKILRISNKLGSSKAFIQVELTRYVLAEEKNRSYPVTYELKRAGLKWKIDQELK